MIYERMNENMYKRLQGVIVGIIIGSMFAGGIAYASTRSVEASFNNIKIVVDGKMIIPKDGNGNAVEPFSVNGTTYLPVRAVAEALGKEVYWDGPNSTLYLGFMNGQLEHPTIRLEDAVNIGDKWKMAKNIDLTDNYKNRYGSAFSFWRTWNTTFETLLNMKYTRFKGTVYVPNGSSGNVKANSFVIKADDKIIYSSPEITKTTAPIQLDIDIRGCNDFSIIVAESHGQLFYFGDAGFYQ